MKNVFIIDSYPDPTHQYFDNRDLDLYRVDEKGHKWEKGYDKMITNPHGTAIGGILSKNIEDSEVKLTFFDIYSSDEEKMLNLLKRSLIFIHERYISGVINCSVGTILFDSELQEIIKLVSKDFIIISAFDNAGAVSYPAAFEQVIGVDSSYRCLKKNDFVIVENSIINVKAKGGLQRVPWYNPEFTLNQGSSFACAYVTAYVVNNYYGMDRNSILNELKKIAKFVYNFDEIQEIAIDKSVENVSFVPFNKEINSVFNFSNQLKFNVSGFYDFKFSGNLGKKVTSFYDSSVETEIKSYKEINYGAIDLLVIGHLEEISNISNINLKEELLIKCLENNVSVFCFDSLHIKDFQEGFDKKGLTLFSADKLSTFKGEKFGKLFIFKTPILGVFGTSRSQGKFTLQLQIKNILERKGYNVGSLGTEPTSFLFDFDYTYPFGYLGIENLTPYQIVEESNYLLSLIDSKSNDIIIVGSQSGTIPQEVFNVGQIPLAQLSFLIGTNPDAIILTINFDDTNEYISRTIHSIENLIDCKVITLGLYPFLFKDGWGIINDKKIKASLIEIENRIQELESIFSCVVVEVGNKQTESKIIETIEAYFS
ncbi:hypothetical protein IGI37_002898 [Enterococcus sp. AZ194]|uniref:DUF1611 domain-containing protein n=1 Tax=Enterococcus sp. AZ194 TaxID=2774629 RepID=UPI003F2335D9